MKVKLIQMTQNPEDVMWVAARTCYASKSPNEMWEDCENDKFNVLTAEKHWKLVKAVLDSGHQSVAEHVYFTFTIEGISRACSHQLVRHRAGIVFSQQSQRYVEIKENINTLQNMIAFPASSKELAMALLSKYFVDVNDNNYLIYLKCLKNYLSQTELGVKAEDARNSLPNATKTNITMSVNFRELIHLCNLRLCTRAQLEIRTLFREIVKCVKSRNENLATYLVPQCEVLGLCTEKNCCGRKPTLKEVISVYEAVKKDTLSTEDWNAIMESIQNPKINEKLQKLMKMESVIE